MTKLLRGSVKDRADICAYTFPGDGSVDVDAAVAAIVAACVDHEFSLFFRPGLAAAPNAVPPVLRVVPLEEGDAYREALGLLVERLTSLFPGSSARVVSPDTVELTSPRLDRPELQAIRLVQVLGS